MDPNFPKLEDLKNLTIQTLGKPEHVSPLCGKSRQFVKEANRVYVFANSADIALCQTFEVAPPGFEEAGPREQLFFNPAEVVAGVVTCGGLCPGLNDVIRTISLTLQYEYGVQKVWGFRYGYEGLSSNRRKEPMELTPEKVADIQHQGGTILGSSRGPQDIDDMIDTLLKFKVNMLFVIGGDGTFMGAHLLAERAVARKLAISVVGIPKTIDNDIFCSERTFGFVTAVEEARKSIASAHEEAEAAWNGIGLVRLMGRDSGFITVGATLANSDVNFCLIREVPFTLEGKDGLFARLEKRLERRHHAVIVVAEGAGQELMSGEDRQDLSGNLIHKDIGLFLKEKIGQHFRSKGIPLTIKYIDPSYTIRSRPANAADSAFCIFFGQRAVHAAMAGKTDMFVGYWNNHFTHVPFEMAVGRRKRIDPCGEMWQTVVSITS